MTGKQKRPGGRTEQNRQAVAAAVLDLIGKCNLDFEVQEVAALAGVHRTTLFRRWPDRGSLIAEALAEHVSRLSVEFTGDWRRDLRIAGYALRDFLSDPVEQAMNRMLAITDSEDFRVQMVRNWEPILDAFGQPIRMAQQRGELSETVDVDIVISMLLSPILSRSVFMRTNASNDLIDRLVDQIIRGCAPD
ncbi:MAG: TetR-like C-terminal domain-containing protein [Sphingorhabdus sp.]